jgi:hypothetical protein
VRAATGEGEKEEGGEGVPGEVNGTIFQSLVWFEFEILPGAVEVELGLVEDHIDTVPLLCEEHARGGFVSQIALLEDL